MNYRENLMSTKDFRQTYIDGLERMIKVRQQESEKKRAAYAERIFTDPESYRADFKKMLGWPLVDHQDDRIPTVKTVKLADEEGYSIYRMQFEILDGLEMTGLYFQMHGDEKKPLVLVQHGGAGTPERISGIYGDTSNYNRMLERVIAHGVHAFAPQLLLWDKKYEVPFDRVDVDVRLKRVGSSITAVELYGIEIRENTYEEEPAFVARRIRQMLDSGTMVRDGENLRPVREEDIVILLRSPGSVGGHFQRALEARGIRCSTGGGVELLQTREIGTLRSILQTIANPRQDIPLLSALASPVFGFTADDLAAVRSIQKKGCIYDALLLDKAAKAKAFLETLAILRKEARMSTIAQLIEKIFTLTRMDSIYAAMEGGDLRAANLQTFYQLAADYETANRKTLGQFLEYLDLMAEKGLITAQDSAGGAVTIMSIHKSKGLEFPVVFLCGLSREFNRESLRAQVLCDRELGLGLSVADTASRVRYPAISKRAIVSKGTRDSVSEELRVLYVAMTRARDRLVMTYGAKNLKNDLTDIALRSGMGGEELLTRDVVCPGEWVLLSALRRTEAGEFHNLGGRPAETRVSEDPWLIRVVEAPVTEGTSTLEERLEQLPDGTEECLRAALSFRYGHDAATRTPSKQTATQRKGRFRDQEAAEQAPEPKQWSRSWRRPAFLGGEVQGKAYGSAIHGVMQYLRYDRCGSIEGVGREIEYLVSQKLITPEQALMADARMIFAFFDSDIGRKLRSGTQHLREFKFSILDDGVNYGDALEGEQVLLQGVVDCALLEEDGITVVDFKTDHVTEETISDVAAHYAPQVQAYAHALSRIYRKNVKKACLYFFRLDRFVEV